MKRDKYMGLDVHQAMTVAVVMDAEGKVVLETMVATEAAAVLRLVKSLSGPMRVTFEESTQAEWLYELLRSHVTQVVVCDPRRNKLLSEGSKADKVDARKLADFANSLFVSLEPLHRLTPNHGKFLEAACYLVDTGHYISDTSHHKHSYYIINNSDLPGFTDSERALVGMLCRYHRKALPSPRHSDYISLPEETKKTLALMIPMLRLADGLDRTRDQRVESVSCELRAGSVNLLLRSNMKTDLEQWAVEQVAEPFRQVYDRTLSVSVQRG